MSETISALEKERDSVRQKERDLTRKIVEMRKTGSAGSKTSNFHKWQAAIDREKKECYQKKRMRTILIKALFMLEISNEDISALIRISETRIAVFRGRVKKFRPPGESALDFLKSQHPF